MDTPIVELGHRLVELDAEYRLLDERSRSGARYDREMADLYETSYEVRSAIAAMTPQSLDDIAVQIQVVHADIGLMTEASELDQADQEGCRRALNVCHNILRHLGKPITPAWAE